LIFLSTKSPTNDNEENEEYDNQRETTTSNSAIYWVTISRIPVTASKHGRTSLCEIRLFDVYYKVFSRTILV
jgi:hypothetical protein